MLQLLIKNGACVNSNGRFHADIAVSNGKIVQIGQKLDLAANRTIDAAHKLVMPGVIDTHVHLPWPSASFDSVDDWESGTTAAVCAGTTTVIEYVVPDQSGRLIPTLDVRMAVASKQSYADFSFHMILRKVTGETISDMAKVVKQGFTSFKIYTAYEGFRLSDEEILRALKAAKELEALVCFHAEDGVLVSFATEQLVRAGKTTVDYYPEAHPYVADVEATNRVIAYAGFIGTPIHIVHVNTQEGARMIGQARRSGLAITGETCPQYLTFTEDVYKSGKPEAHHFVLAPLIRTEEDRRGLWRALAEGDLQMIATDHCPYTLEQKLKGHGDFRNVPGGASGVETSLPLIYTYGVRTGRISIEKLVELMSTNPARIFDLYPNKGIIAIGSDADLVIYDEEGESTIDSQRLHSRTDHTLYQGMRVLGRPAMTILRGRIVAQDGELETDRPAGQVLRRPPYSGRGGRLSPADTPAPALRLGSVQDSRLNSAGRKLYVKVTD